MSRGTEEFEAAEIVIVRRGGRGGEDGHHGGVWKIAYADFMTAMMAFFLVMWLVNAANEKTKQQVASYFNPIKLIDTRTNDKGLQSMDTGSRQAGKIGDPSGARREPEGEASGSAAAPDKPADTMVARQDEAQTQHEAPVLKDILLIQGLTGQQGFDQSERAAPKAARQASEATADPAGSQDKRPRAVVPASSPEPDGAGVAADDSGETVTSKPLGELLAKADRITSAAHGDAVGPQQGKHVGGSPEQAQEKPPAAPVAGAEVAGDKRPSPEPAEVVAIQAASEKHLDPLESIKRKIRQSGYTPLVEGLSLNVEETREGVLISMTESTSTAMFDIATAKPSPALVKLAGQLASVLKSSGGRITIRGHTDGRNFFTAEQDNWRLSTDRAHAAYRLLLDAGLPPARFERIEGYADTLLKVKADPLAASNRRVEVLLRAEKERQ